MDDIYGVHTCAGSCGTVQLVCVASCVTYSMGTAQCVM